MSIVIGSGVDPEDYDIIFDHLWCFLQIHLDVGVAFVVSERGDTFVPYLQKRLCRACIMTPGKELETLLTQSLVVFLVTQKPTTRAFRLKEQCDYVGVPNMLLTMTLR